MIPNFLKSARKFAETFRAGNVDRLKPDKTLSSDRVRSASKIESKVIKTTKTGRRNGPFFASFFRLSFSLGERSHDSRNLHSRSLRQATKREESSNEALFSSTWRETRGIEGSSSTEETVPFFMAERRHEENKKGCIGEFVGHNWNRNWSMRNIILQLESTMFDHRFSTFCYNKHNKKSFVTLINII